MEQNTCRMPTLKQGDECIIPVTMYFNGERLGAEHLPLLEAVEFTLGDEGAQPVCLPAADCWSEALEAFALPVTQEQTFALEEGRTALDVRVRFRGGGVLGVRRKANIQVADATSERVI